MSTHTILRRHRPRIALVSWHTSPMAAPGAGRAGGMNVYVRELAAALARRGMTVDIITSRPGASSSAAHRLASGLRLLALSRRDVDPWRLALPRYDVVHSHYWQSAAIADVLVRCTGARHVHTFHTLGEAKNAALAPGDAPESDDRLAAERQIAAAADAVVVATATERRQLVEQLSGAVERVHVVAPGVDLTRFAPRPARATRARLGLGHGLLAVHVGRIQPLKGIDVAVRGLAELSRELGDRCTLAVAGSPSGPTGALALQALRREARRLAPRVSVRLLGRLDHRVLPLLLSTADVAVVPSRSESFCLAALEAQACGAPVIGTAVGGLPDFVIDGESGYLVAREPAAFARRLGDVLGSAGQRRRMRRAAVESAHRFSWTATAAGVAAAYEC